MSATLPRQPAAPRGHRGAPWAVRAAGRPLLGALSAWLVLVAAVLGAGVAAGVAVVAPTTASADDSTPPLTVTLAAITPSSPTAKDTLVITGTVKNTGTRAVTAAQVLLWRSTDSLGDRNGLDEALASTPDNPLGRRMVGAANIFDITDVGTLKSQLVPAGKASFAPGETARFTVRAPVGGANSLGLDQPGVYLVGVQVRGVPQGGANQTLGRARSLLVVQSATQPPTSHTVDAVLLNSKPSLVVNDTFTDDHLSGELRGRLGRLLALARQDGTTLLVDPALYDELQVMAKGYKVQGSTDAAARKQGQQRAAAFLQALQPLLVAGRAYRTLYGSPDVARAVDSGRGDLLAQAARLPSGHALAALPLGIVPANLRISQTVVQQLAGLKPLVVFAANLRAADPVQHSDQLTVVRTAASAFNGGPGPEPATTLAQVTGRLQAEQRLSAQPLVTIASTTMQADAELASAGWRQRVPLSQLVSAATPATTATAQFVDTPGSSAAPAWFQALDQTASDVQAWGELVDRSRDAQTLTRQALPAGISTAWYGDEGAALAWLARVRGQVGSVLSSDKVRLRTVASFVTSASGQDIPVTITNSLQDPVKVKVQFLSENPQRISVADTDVVTVAAGESETVKVHVTSRSNGQVGVTARLATAQGRQIGNPRSLTITATEAGRVGWIIIIASGVVLLAGTAIRIRQVQRERRLPHTGSNRHTDPRT